LDDSAVTPLDNGVFPVPRKTRRRPWRALAQLSQIRAGVMRATIRRRPFFIFVIAFAGCRPTDVTHYQVRKGAETRVASRPPEHPRADDLPPPAPNGASALKWTLPKGWTESGASGMRMATLKPAVTGEVDVSVVVLPGPVGGELAIVNRWRVQIGLSATDERGLASSRSSVQSKAGTVSVYEFSSERVKRSRLIAALLLSDESIWFVKMLGEEAAVTSARPKFMRLLESLRFDAAN